MYINMQEDQTDTLALALTRQNTKHFLVQELKSLWILMQALRSQLPFTEVVMYITGWQKSDSEIDVAWKT